MKSIRLEKNDRFGFTTQSGQILEGCCIADTRNVKISCSDSIAQMIGDKYFRTVGAFSVASDNELFSEVDGVLFSKDGSCLVAFPPRRGGAYSIPEWVVRIGEGAFAHSCLTSLSFPVSLHTIENDAFCHCEKIRDLQLPDQISIVGPRTFAYCQNLESVSLPDKVARIESQMFLKCDNLVRIDVKKGRRVFATTAFDCCPKLQALTIPENGFDGWWWLDYTHRFEDIDPIGGTWEWLSFIGSIEKHPLSKYLKLDPKWKDSDPPSDFHWF